VLAAMGYAGTEVHAQGLINRFLALLWKQR
jgi:hypothetical protein